MRRRPALGTRRLQGDGEKPTGAVGDAPAGRAGADAIQAAIAEPSEHAVVEFDRALQFRDREIDVTERASDHALFALRPGDIRPPGQSHAATSQAGSAHRIQSGTDLD